MSQDRTNQGRTHKIQRINQLSDQDLHAVTAGICTTCVWASEASGAHVKAIEQGKLQAPAGVKEAFSSLATKAGNDAMQAHALGVKIWQDCPNCKANGAAFQNLKSQVTRPS